MNSERTGERSNRRLRRLMAASLGIFICLPQATYSEAFCEMSGKAEVNMQQDKLTIQGVVKDEEGEPIPGASVVLKGMTNVGTITDIEGNFSLSYPASEKKPELLVSFVGMGTQTVNIAGKKSIVIRLRSEISSLDEVVVTDYGSRLSQKFC